jgi:hypothetical protein
VFSGLGGTPNNSANFPNPILIAGRALIDIRAALRDRFRIGPAAWDSRIFRIAVCGNMRVDFFYRQC